MQEFLEGGDLDKFIVLNVKDVERYANNTVKEALTEANRLIKEGRVHDCRNPNKRYLVINVDKSYAPEIVQILKQNGDWG
jgi:hypothetical protein